ncbi:hypothetical protein SEA_WEASELS2_257 [Rhodococcus phage Weasels2]|uniref:Uncharacterized protein n=1 Tax=Rhodococcus phage Weasels2 TaxID=1897437 RepID=A0A1I9SAM9_9CAUD|nr:hypothetical protein FDH04_gp159 [Rhodococcus phage Weasels2]AOZ63835.1 hypothetical protein SEA_WEASELS2_257 [Rhodococcus phage Weasels2]
MIIAIWAIVSILTWPFMAKWLLENVPVGKATTIDYYMATALGLCLSFSWPLIIPVLLIVLGGKYIIFGSTNE